MTKNLSSKILIANWVEERQCAHLEQGNRNPDGTMSTKIHRTGHKGILSTDEPQSVEACSTTVQSSYQTPSQLSVRTTGRREDMLRDQLYEMVSGQVKEEANPPAPPVEYTSTTQRDFNKDFTPMKIPPTMSHDLTSESPVSYWTENLGAVHGVSQVGNEKVPFAKNTAFSKPIEEYLDQTQPHS